LWRATITPLASIIGSGFLVLAPILVYAYGSKAPLVMGALVLGAYLFGSAIRFNISIRSAPVSVHDYIAEKLEIGASWALALAFMISVTYYLNLFGAFGLSLTAFNSSQSAKLLSSVIFLIILAVGYMRGFSALEKMEYTAVTFKLAIIAGLLVGLGYYCYAKAVSSTLVVHPPQLTGWAAITLAFGLIITVQGFETSRYLGDEYSAADRIKSMRLSQLVAAAIYMIYITLFALSFEHEEFQLTETAIIDVMGMVAPVLPWILVVGALAAQFSAAIADTSGSGGLIAELTRERISTRNAYVLLVIIGLTLTWSADVFQIISYASRAFALYYTLQAAIAARIAFLLPDQRWRSLLFAVLVIFGLLIVGFGDAVEV
tara:strand:+ start:5283 stop:6404 length:1122 start_codon:yes stop_codon:yes gene_type:complete